MTRAIAAPDPPAPPRLSLFALFALFLRFGALAWGGPIAQIGMLQHELVERRRWTTDERFRRALAVYQALPGPEAHELCCWFGHLARGRRGSLVAGLGFLLPGTALTLLAAHLYRTHGLASPTLAAAFAGMQAAVVALVVRAVPRIAARALRPRAAWIAAAAGAIGEWAGLPFWLPLAFGAAWLPLAHRPRAAALVVLSFAGAAVALSASNASTLAPALPPAPVPIAATPLHLFALGLQAGLLTFGGAYTAIPLVRNEAVVTCGWLDDAQFLDAIAIGGVLPAPLIVFGTFVGYLAGGLVGALAITVGTFLPAFAFGLIGHRHIERLVAAPPAHRALDGIAAAVVGLIAVTAARLAVAACDAPWRVAVFAAALSMAFATRAPWSAPTIVASAALVGLACG